LLHSDGVNFELQSTYSFLSSTCIYLTNVFPLFFNESQCTAATDVKVF